MKLEVTVQEAEVGEVKAEESKGKMEGRLQGRSGG